jgi:hypothetical protein
MPKRGDNNVRSLTINSLHSKIYRARPDQRQLSNYTCFLDKDKIRVCAVTHKREL